MPSSSRKCFAKKLRDYLKFKSLVLNVTVQSETELLSLLNTAEIKTVGGEVLLTWGGPVLSSIVNPEVGHEVLMEIAMTQPSHYLTNGVLYSCLQKMADALLSFMIQHEEGLMNFRVLSHVHNLIPFTDSRILEASAKDLKMYVRTVLSDNEKTLCLSQKDRDLMRNLILKVCIMYENNAFVYSSYFAGLWSAQRLELSGPAGAGRSPDRDEEFRPGRSVPHLTQTGRFPAGQQLCLLLHPD